MAAINDADVSIDVNGNIRWTGAATTNRHTVLEFIQWLMDKQDDGVAAGDDILDITVDTPFERSTDQIVTLNSPFNIDNTFATHLYDGSVSQTDPDDGGETIYGGLRVIGPVEAGTEYMILQGNRVLPAFWGTGINAEAAPSLVFSRHLVKFKHAGALIDGGRITVLVRELGDKFARFPATLGTGNAVAAIGNGADVFNAKTDATLGGFTDIVNTEGFQEINIDGTGAAGQEFYSQWDKGSRVTNDVYERTKWISQRAHVADSTGGTPTGADFTVNDNAGAGTIVAQAQSFIPPSGVGLTEKLVEVRFTVKRTGSPGGNLYCELFDSDDASPGIPTGSALARSEEILGSAITTTYEEVIFRFNRRNPATGADQRTGLDLANAEYYIAIKSTVDGDATNLFQVQGASTSVDATMDRAEESPAATWTGSATSDLNMTVKSCPPIHGMPGELMQGINVEVGYDGEAGGGVLEDDIAFWGTKVFYDTLVSGPFRPGERIKIGTGATADFATVLFDDGVDELVFALDSPGAGVLADDEVITSLRGSATETTAAINVAGGAIEDQNLSGGEGLVLAKDDNGATGELYIQTIFGVNPVDNNRIRSTTSPLANYVDATATINTRTLVPEFVGTSTGSNIIGAYGIGYDPLDVGSSDRFTSLDNTSRIPPNNVQFTVSGLAAGEDRVLVGPRTGSALERGQWLVSTALTAIGETALVVKTGVDTVPFPDAEENWPDTGIGADVSRLRIQRDDGIYQLIPYDSHDGVDTFTLGTPVTGTINIEVSQVGGTGGQFDRISAGSFITDGFEQGARITGAGFTNAGNNTDFTIDSVTATTIVVVDDTGMVNESAGGGNETLTSAGWDFTAAPGTEGTGPSGWNSDDASVNNNVFMAFIDVLAGAGSVSFTGVHGGTNRDLFVRVRDGGGTPIKTFQNVAAQFLSTPQTVAVNRISDA